jgi:hypothetical protein
LSVPIGIFVGRNNIRASRREVVRDLERLFSFARLPDDAPLVIPSFELVKYKYGPASSLDRNIRDNRLERALNSPSLSSRLLNALLADPAPADLAPRSAENGKTAAPASRDPARMVPADVKSHQRSRSEQ